MNYYMNCSLDEAIFRHLKDEEDAEARLPTCDCCGEPIHSERWFECEPGEKFCEDCKDEWISERSHWIQ